MISVRKLILAVAACLFLHLQPAWSHGTEGAELSDALVDLHKLPIGKPLTEAQVVEGLEQNSATARYQALLHLLRLKLSPERAIGLLAPQLEHEFEASPATDLFRQSVIVVLARYGPQAKATIPALARVARTDKSQPVRDTAVRAIGAIGRNTPSAVAALTSLVEGNEEKTALVALQTLGRMKTVAANSTPTLSRALTRQWTVAHTAPYAAFVALGQIEKPTQRPSAEEAVARLKQHRQLTPGQLSQLLLTLQEFETIAAAATPELLAIAKSPNPEYLTGAALYTLGHVGLSFSEEPARLLLDTITANRPALAPIAHRALEHIKLGDKASAGPLARAVESQDVAIRQLAARALAKLGPDAQPATMALANALAQERRLETEKPEEFAGRMHDYLMALLSIGARARDAVPTLVQLLADDSPLFRALEGELATGVRIDLLMVLNGIGMPADAAQRATILEAVRSALATSDFRLFSTAARAAGNLGAEAAGLVPLLLRGLATDGSAPVQILNGIKIVPPATRFEAIRALGKIGPAAVAAVPHLERIIANKDVLSTQLNGEARLALKAIAG